MFSLMRPPNWKSPRVVSKSSPRVRARLPPSREPVWVIRLMTPPGELEAKVEAEPPRTAWTRATVAS